MANKVQFVLEGDEAKAVAAFLKVVDAQNKATAGMRKMTREGQQTSSIISGGIRSIAGALGLLSIPATLLTQVRNIVKEMKEAVALKKEMHETALTTEQLAMKIAHLREDVSRGGIAAATKDVADVAKQAAVSLDVASKALFYAESAMGAGKAPARAAAIAISKFAAPALLTPEEVKLAPKFFQATQAFTQEEQLRILNQIRKATARSIAETGEYLGPFVGPMIFGTMQGFTFSQMLSHMTAAIEAEESPEKAATALQAALEIATGKTKKALDFYYKEARKRGVDFAKLTMPERFEFTRSLYQELEKAGPAAMDIFRVTVGGKGFRHVGKIFSDVAQRKYFEVLPEIEAARESGIVQQLAQQYLSTLTAERIGRERRVQIGAMGVGLRRRPEIVLEEMTEDILKQSKALTRGFGEYLGWAITPGAIERHKVASMLIRSNLRLALEAEPWPTARRAELQELWQMLPLIESFRLNPEFVQRAYMVTEGFTLPEIYGRRAVRPAETAYQRGFQEYFGLSEKTAENLTKGLKDTTNALNRLTDKIPDQILSSPLSPEE